MRKRIKLIVGLVVGVVVVAVAAVVVLILTRDDAPEAVDLESTVARLAADGADEEEGTSSASEGSDSNESGTSANTGDAAADETGANPPDTATEPTANDNDVTDATDNGEAGLNTGAENGETGVTDAATDNDTDRAYAEPMDDATNSLAGVWTVERAEGEADLLGEPVVSFAGFRVDEVLGGGIGDFTAVGRTADVSGSLELTDTALVAATVEVQMATLRTDNGSRDGRIRQTLNTSEFPLGVFTLVEPLELPTGAAEGEPFSGSAVGDLTIKGVTNRVVFDLEAQLLDDKIVAVGSSEVLFSDYGITAPSAPIVVSVEDQGIMEFQLIFTAS